MIDVTFSVAFTLWDYSTSWIELIAVLLGLVMVVFTITEQHWGWLFAILSSALYFLIFWKSRLYGDALLQLLFIALAAWGWWLWLRGTALTSLRITQLTPQQRWGTTLIGMALWAITGYVLRDFTDTDVPWWDAFPTAFSLVGQYLLAHKRVENWWAWLAVNVVAVGLFAWKALWLTSLLYIVFAVLSVVGWRTWLQRSHRVSA
ncbi:nicotinamide riboside transporter PnuC [Limnohabitans sp.]|uniref:nicotinamide riboside transporter PnuC n=1 Tax=Limnohabitans sp. TaxID=1907725 RepID=UPI00286F7047|nr:nicotinamide riboside transporter PnuC [Limnohabitans sp.]